MLDEEEKPESKNKDAEVLSETKRMRGQVESSNRSGWGRAHNLLKTKL